jgi:hypothetical protein
LRTPDHFPQAIGEGLQLERDDAGIQVMQVVIVKAELAAEEARAWNGRHAIGYCPEIGQARTRHPRRRAAIFIQDDTR